MKTSTKRATIALTMLFAVTDLNVGAGLGLGKVSGLSTAAEAAVVVRRRPAVKPVSPAGVARRTTRRVIRRGAYIAVIPVGCGYGTYYGYSLYYCGGVYYQKSGGGYVVVYF